jgi:hypothetical protein
VAAQQRSRFIIRILNFKQTLGKEHWNLSFGKACDQSSCFLITEHMRRTWAFLSVSFKCVSQGMADKSERLRYAGGEARLQKEGKDLRCPWTPATWAFPDQANWPNSRLWRSLHVLLLYVENNLPLIVRCQFIIHFIPSLNFRFPDTAKASPIMGRNSQFLDEDANKQIH